jgi:hypothetical protein
MRLGEEIMQKTITGLLAILGLLTLYSSTSSANEGSIAFVGARIIDGTMAAPIEDGVVVITDGRIRTVGPRSAVTLPAGAQIIDVAGKTIMPGLIKPMVTWVAPSAWSQATTTPTTYSGN